MVGRLSELALRLLNGTSPLDRSGLLRALGTQVRILEKLMEAPEESGGHGS